MPLRRPRERAASRSCSLVREREKKRKRERNRVYYSSLREQGEEEEEEEEAGAKACSNANSECRRQIPEDALADERKWYDEHREDILRGRAVDDSESSEDSDGPANRGRKTGTVKLKKREVNLWSYFSASAYEGFGTHERPTTKVFSLVFESVS